MQSVTLAIFVALGVFVAPALSMIVITRSSPPCSVDTIAKREERASVIVSGYIDKIVREPKKTVYKCEIKIVRVFKGADEYLHKDNAISPIMEDNKIMVGGFGDPNICSNMAREGDTKILFMRVDDKGHLMLNSSLLTITYNNLEVLDGAVNDLPVITKPPLEKGACDRILCTFGAYCQEMDGGKPKCICPDSCEGVSAPVCGSDRVTYQSECHMKVASCQNKQLVTVLNHGECVDPCEEMSCGYGEVCVINADGAVCKCMTECDDVEAEVCGSNGVVYRNQCELMAAACRRQKNITIIYEGACDPCKGQDMEEGTVCRLDALRNAVPECTEGCPDEFSPVCGSDGIMYDNTCQMQHAGCLLNMDLTEIPEEGCAENGPCVKQPCEFGSCQLSASLDMSCVCPPECEAIYVPVCASDGNTYHSVCHMEREACLNKVELMVLHKRECEQDLDVCSRIECKFGATCSVEGGVGTCGCNMNCSQEVDPVCGSDMVTYPSACEVQRAICLQQTEIDIISMGDCDLCEGYSCEFGGYCRMSDDGPVCGCAEFCNENYEPVCGSDGTTYPNMCYLSRASCRMSKEITVASEGPCDMCENINCTNGAVCKRGICKCVGNCPFLRDPVCGTNGVTYENECKLKLAKCRRDATIELAYSGECIGMEEISGEGSGEEESGDYSGTSTPYSSTISISMSELHKCDEASCAYGGVCVPASLGMRCACNMSCPAIRSMVCGSDGDTYGNECQMREASCEQQKSIVKDECEDVEQEPCDGDTPLTNQRGEELSCTEMNRGDECPSGSYCHIHPMGNFAVCCPEETATPAASLCEGSPYGCCPDGETPAEGMNEEGCEEKECNCNSIGAYTDTCDDKNQCPCRSGVTGELCDSCAPGYWNFKGILNGNEGCEPCDCNKAGSARDDCGQNHGECVCKEGITGIKCDKCPAGMIMGSLGCENDAATEAMTCADRECSFGADCVDMNDTSICKCPSDCPGTGDKVCGSDGQTYSTECQMKVISCRSEKDIYVESTGPCEEPTIQEPTEVMAACSMSEYGCCPDGETEAMGDNYEGCDGTTTMAMTVDGTQSPDITIYPAMGCESSPCKRGGTCVDTDMDPGFICHCPLGTGGPVCKETMDFTYPSFSGNSYIAYETIAGFLEVSMIMEFKASVGDGILLYNGQFTNGAGDYIALVLVDNHVELRFDLGSRENVVVRSNVEIEMDEWYRVVASRMRRKGTLSVEGEPRVSKSTQSGSSGLNLNTEMFIGNVAEGHDRVYSRLGVSGGLKGCIRLLEVKNQAYDLKHPQEMGDMLYGANIGDCDADPCLNHKCQHNTTCIPTEGNSYMCQCTGDFVGPYCADVFVDPCEGHMCHFGSTCVPEPTGSYRCDCPPNVMGDRCDQVMEPMLTGPFIPGFGGNSYLELAGLKMSKEDRIEVEFLATEENGLVLYQGQQSDGAGDFISLSLVSGHVEYRYDLGSGPAELRSSEPVSLNVWLDVVLTRTGRDGSLEIEGLELIEGTSKDIFPNETEPFDPELPEGQDPEGANSQLNLLQNMYLGGVPNYSEISRKAGITDGLNGAIRKLILNGEEVTDFQESAINQVNIVAYVPDVCKTDPCIPGFLCDVDTGDCVCPEDLIQDGDKCVPGEMTMATGMVTSMDEVITDEDMVTDEEMDMGTEAVMVEGTEEPAPEPEPTPEPMPVTDEMVPPMMTHPPLVDMETDDGTVTEASRTSKLISAIMKDTTVSMEMIMDNKMTTSMMDMTTAGKPDKEPMAEPSPEPSPEPTKRMTSFPPPPPMTTTAPPRRTTTMQEEPTTTMALTTTMLPTTTAVPSTLEPVDVDDPVSFTGVEQYAYDNKISKKVKAQSINGFTIGIKTDQENGLIMFNGPRDFIGLAVVNGYVNFAYQLGAGTLRIQSTVYVADNIWHTIRADRYVRDATLVVDSEEPVLGESRAGASQLNTNGVLYIGGAPNVPGNGKLPKGFSTGFIGCIGFAEIDDEELHLFYAATGDRPQKFCSSSRP